MRDASIVMRDRQDEQISPRFDHWSAFHGTWGGRQARRPRSTVFSLLATGMVIAMLTGRNRPLNRRRCKRITGRIWWGHHTGSHSAEPLRLGKQTLCQLSYSRSGGWGRSPAARIYHWSPEMGEPAGHESWTHGCWLPESGAVWWALRRWSRARWTGGGASRHRESPGGTGRPMCRWYYRKSENGGFRRTTE